jgi:hypothetical protein
MNKFKLKLAGLTAATLALPATAFAQSNPFISGQTLTSSVGSTAYGVSAPQSLTVIIGRIINTALGFLGVVFLFLVLYAGFLWMTAQGEEKQVTKAKDIMKQAVVGLIVIVAGFAISNFVMGSLVNVTQG